MYTGANKTQTVAAVTRLWPVRPWPVTEQHLCYISDIQQSHHAEHVWNRFIHIKSDEWLCVTDWCSNKQLLQKSSDLWRCSEIISDVGRDSGHQAREERAPALGIQAPRRLRLRHSSDHPEGGREFVILNPESIIVCWRLRVSGLIFKWLSIISKYKRIYSSISSC